MNADEKKYGTEFVANLQMNYRKQVDDLLEKNAALTAELSRYEIMLDVCKRDKDALRYQLQEVERDAAELARLQRIEEAAKKAKAAREKASFSELAEALDELEAALKAGE